MLGNSDPPQQIAGASRMMATKRVGSVGYTQGAATMRRTRMYTAPYSHSRFSCVARPQSKMRNDMEEVVGWIPTRSANSPANWAIPELPSRPGHPDQTPGHPEMPLGKFAVIALTAAAASANS